VIHTTSIARLNATFRARVAPLARRGRALARRPLTLEHGMSLLGTVSNFCSLQARLGNANGPQTPAMVAGITDHGWTRHELLSCHVPPPRWTPPKQHGRPSRSLQRLVERWCA
jgi:hypothetical protein